MRYTDFFFYTNQPTLCARLHIVVNVIAVVILGLVNDDKTSVMFILMETFQVYNKVKAGRSAQEVAAVHFFKVSGHPNYLPLMLFLVILVN